MKQIQEIIVAKARREKFVELAESRVNRSIKDIHLIGNLSNRSNYEYSEKDVKKICAALNKALIDMKKRFETNEPETGKTFKL